MLLLLLAALAQTARGNSEKGQPPEACYSTPLSSNTASVIYTKSAGPRDTTFTFLVSTPSLLKGSGGLPAEWHFSWQPQSCDTLAPAVAASSGEPVTNILRKHRAHQMPAIGGSAAG